MDDQPLKFSFETKNWQNFSKLDSKVKNSVVKRSMTQFLDFLYPIIKLFCAQTNAQGSVKVLEEPFLHKFWWEIKRKYFSEREPFCAYILCHSRLLSHECTGLKRSSDLKSVTVSFLISQDLSNKKNL